MHVSHQPFQTLQHPFILLEHFTKTRVDTDNMDQFIFSSRLGTLYKFYLHNARY